MCHDKFMQISIYPQIQRRSRWAVLQIQTAPQTKHVLTRLALIPVIVARMLSAEWSITMVFVCVLKATLAIQIWAVINVR